VTSGAATFETTVIPFDSFLGTKIGLKETSLQSCIHKLPAISLVVIDSGVNGLFGVIQLDTGQSGTFVFATIVKPRVGNQKWRVAFPSSCIQRTLVKAGKA
jgi:hypothetical protein